MSFFPSLSWFPLPFREQADLRLKKWLRIHQDQEVYWPTLSSILDPLNPYSVLRLPDRPLPLLIGVCKGTGGLVHMEMGEEKVACVLVGSNNNLMWLDSLVLVPKFRVVWLKSEKKGNKIPVLEIDAFSVVVLWSSLHFLQFVNYNVPYPREVFLSDTLDFFPPLKLPEERIYSLTEIHQIYVQTFSFECVVLGISSIFSSESNGSMALENACSCQFSCQPFNSPYYLLKVKDSVSDTLQLIIMRGNDALQFFPFFEIHSNYIFQSMKWTELRSI